MKTKTLIVLVILAALAVACGRSEPVEAKQVELQFITHLAAGMAEQDVFIMDEARGGLLRVTTAEEAQLAQQAYAAAEVIPHDLFGLGDNPVGPYPAGQPLDMTLGDWLGATGGGTYTIVGDEAELDVHFSNLVANGVYTLWCGRTFFPPEARVVDTPCGRPDGSENVMIADPNGRGEFRLTVSPFEASTEEAIAFVAIAWHRDGQTYGPSPGDFGLNSHVQLFAAIPTPGDVAWQTTTVAANR